MASAFRTVPLYRERWALDGRTDPILVSGRTGTYQGAIPFAEALRRKADLVPLAGGPQWIDAGRGRRFVTGADPLHHQTLGFLGGVRECGRQHLYFDSYPRLIRHLIDRGGKSLSAGRAMLDVKRSLGFTVQPRRVLAVPRPLAGRSAR